MVSSTAVTSRRQKCRPWSSTENTIRNAGAVNCRAMALAAVVYLLAKTNSVQVSPMAVPVVMVWRLNRTGICFSFM